MPVACILVVDDYPDIRSGIKRILETAGYWALSACDGYEALDALRSHHIDLVLADIRMPKMNGYQLYLKVIEVPEWASIPFVFLTALGLDSDIRYGKELGVDDYLVKPVTPEELLSAVRGRLRRARHRAESGTLEPSDVTDLQGVLEVGPLRIDPGRYRVTLSGQLLQFSLTEFKALHYLARHTDRVVSFQELVKVTHGLDSDAIEAGGLLRPVVRSLRRKLGYPAGEMGCIENVRGVGYRLKPFDDS
jgi:DNA-binding response OmpR family regulator